MPSSDKFALGGIIPPLVTPLKSQDEIDADGLKRLVAHVLEGGVHGIFVLGTTGEGPSLSHRVRRQVIQAVCQQVAGAVPVLVNVSDTSFVESIELACYANDAGASAVAVTPPFYFLISQEDLLSYVERLTAVLSLPLMLYNYPLMTKTAFEPEIVRQAAKFPGVIGVKDSSGDLGWTREVLKLLADQPEFKVMVGPEDNLVEALRAGASGGVCGGANLLPSLFTDLYKAVMAGDWQQAETLQEEVRGLGRGLYTVGEKNNSYLRGIKEALAHAGLCQGLPAMPVQPFSALERKTLQDRMDTRLSTSKRF